MSDAKNGRIDIASVRRTQIVEAARLISQRMFQEGGPLLADQITWAFRLVASRRPTAHELAVLKQLFAEQRELKIACRPFELKTD